MKSNRLLEVSALQKSFGGLQAVDVDSLEFSKNQITSLIGPNGAGKTTFFDLITKFQNPDKGTLTIRLPRHNCLCLHIS